MSWNPFKFERRPARRRPFRRRDGLRLEELETRVVPATNITAYHQASPVTNPPSTVGAGVNSNETVLTPGNVNATNFGKLFATTVDGQVYAQPLYVENVNITTGANQGTHNVVFVATEHDSLYAIDANTGTLLWKDALLTPEHAGTVTSVPNNAVNSSDIAPEIGITATPVIDPATGTIFVENKTQEVASDGTHFEHHLYAINLGSGAITSKVLIADSIGDTVVSGPSVQGTGAGSSGGVVKFDSLRQMERPGLSLVNGSIYLAYASHGDNGPYHGWILGYSESGLAPTAVFNVNPNGSDDGIWQSGGSLAYETVNGNTFLYFETGNGTFDTTLAASPFTAGLMIPNKGDYGDSFVKVQVDGSMPATGSLNATNNVNGWGMHVADYFTPMNEGNLSNGDTDLGSGAPLLLPASAGSAAHPSLMVGSGKQGRIYLIDRNNMGGYHGDASGSGNSGSDNVVQETAGGAINGSLDTATFFNGVLYYVGGYGDPARTFTIANASMSGTSVTQSTDSYSFPGSTPTISTNPSGANAIVWDIAGPGTNQLRAYNAGQGYSSEIYTSAQAAGSRDALGSAVKFTVPTVADGEVFVGTTNSLVAYGLLQQATAAPAAPTNLSATAVSGSVISLSWTDHDTAPNSATGFNVLESTDGTNFAQVGTASAGATSFAVGGLQANTKYYFEIDAFNAVGTSAFTNVANATTTSQVGVLDFSSGFAGSAGVLTYNGNAKVNGTNALLTDGGNNEAASVFSTNAVDVTKFSNQFTFQLTNANADGFTFTIQGVGPTALGSLGGGLGYAGIGKSVAVKLDLFNNAGEGTDSTGEYTNGASPTTPAVDLTNTGVNLHSGDVFQVVMGYDGTTLSVTITDTTTNATASQSYAVNIPQLVGGNTGYVGFTGGTGGTTAVQNIRTWVYSPTASSAPAAPSALTGTVVSGSEIDISWTNNANNATSVLIDRSGDGVNFTQINSVSATTNTYHDTSLSPGNTYYYKVQASNAAGNSPFSNVFQASTVVAPAPPTNLAAVKITPTEVDLTWTNVATNATGIKILKQLGNNSSQIVATGLAPTTTSYNITGLTPGSPYTFEIDALNSNGPSGAATISADTLPSQVTGVTATAGPGQIALTWAADPGAAGYNVYRSTTPGGEGATPAWTGIAGTTYVDGTATPGTTYYYLVTAVDPHAASPTDPTAESAASAEVSAQAGAAGPSINFGGGFAGATGLTLNGSAAVSGANLVLTDGGANEAASAFVNTAQYVTSFSTQFTFQITPGTTPTADGFTLVIQNAGLTALGPAGGGLGYGPNSATNPTPSPNTPIGQSVAIKFDLFSNDGEGVDSTGLYTNGQAPTVAGSLAMTGSVDLHSGDVMQGNLTYDGSNLVETVKDLTTSGTFTHTYTGVNIPSVVGGNTAFVGFTGGTGGQTAVQAIQSWTFTQAAGAFNAPSGLAGAAQSGPQVQLTWNDNSTAETGFTVQRATDPAFSQNVTTLAAPANAGATATYVDTTVVPGTTYYYRVQAANAYATTAFSNPVSAAFPSLPATPSNGHATLITATAVNLAWTNNATNADVYKIFREVVGQSFVQIASLSGNATSFNDSGLTPGTNYDYHIEAWNISGFNDRTGANLYTVSPAVTNLTATAGAGQVQLAWTAPPGAPNMTYNVYRGTTPGGEGATAVATGLTSPSYTDTNLTGGTTYYYQVTSVDPQSLATPSVAPFGESARSNEASAVAQQATLVLAISAGGPAAGSFVADTDFTGGTVSGGTSATIGTAGLSNPPPQSVLRHGRFGNMTYTLPGLTPGTNYSVRLDFVEYVFNAAGSRVFNVAINGTQVLSSFDIWAAAGGQNVALGKSFTAAASASGTITVGLTSLVNNAIVSGIEVYTTGPATPPSAPTGLSATAGNNQVGLSWTAVTGATGYDVYRGTSSGGETLLAAGTNVSIASFTDTTAVNGTQYFYYVTSLNGNLQSGNSNEVSATPQAAPPAAPTGLAATPGNNQVGLTWTTVSGATGYDVYRGTTSGGETLLAAGTNVSTASFTDTTAVNGTQYFYYVTALNGTLQSGHSNEVSATPQKPSTGTLVLAIAAGGPAAAPFVADTDFTGGTVSGGTHAAINAGGLTNPPPQSVLQHGRFGNMTYTLPGLTPGTNYSVRLDFVEYVFNAAGQRVFNVSVNGAQVLSSFDIWAAAGGQNVALGKSFTAAASASGTITVGFTSLVNNAIVSGIEVYTAGQGAVAAAKATLLSAAPGTAAPTVAVAAGPGPSGTSSPAGGSNLRALDAFLARWGSASEALLDPKSRGRSH